MSTKPAMQVIYQRNEAVLAARLGAEDVALLDPARENYFGLEGPACRIWELLEAPSTAGAICETLQGEYDVDPEVCASQTQELLDDLVTKQVIVPRS